MNNLVRDAAYIHYAANKARVQNAMKRLDESTNVLTEEQINQIILEEFNATEILNKIKQVFTNMTNKFVEYTKKQIQNRHDPEYLNAIKDKAAEACKGKDIPLEMLPYWTGTENIKNMANIFSKFDNRMYDQVKADNKDAYIANIQKYLMQNFNPQGQIKFDQYCENYFQGGDGTSQKMSTNTNQLGDRMNGIVQWCIDFPQTLNTIHNDINGLMGLVAKAVPTAQPTQQTTEQVHMTQKNTSESATVDTFTKADIHHKAYKYKNILESVFSEAGEKPQPPAGQPAANANPPAGGNNGQSATTTTDGSKTMSLGKNDNNVSGVQIDQNAATQEQKKNQDIGMYMGAVQNVATTILNARLRSTNIIYNDYIKILQTVCPRNEYMNKQPAGGNPQPNTAPGNGQNPAPAPGNGQNTSATGNGNS